MPLQDRIRFLKTSDDVDAFLKDHPSAVLFKAGSCHKTQETFARIQPSLEAREDLPVGVIRVLEARPASDRVAEHTGIRHQSPQVLLFKDGKVVFDRDNWAITSESVAEALEGHFTRV